MSIKSRIFRTLTPRVGSMAPGANSAVIHKALDRAIAGVGPLPGAAQGAESHLSDDSLATLKSGNALPKRELDEAVKAVISSHLRLAATQGFLTNVGGLASMAATVPANLAGLALVQIHMVAGIAHLGGHDLDDPLVRDAVLACLLEEDALAALVKKGTLPGTPRQLLDASTVRAAGLERVIASEVTNSLIGRVSGRRLTTTVGRRVPLLGGAVGGAADARATKALGSYAARELARAYPR